VDDEIESEAEINELVIDKMVDDVPVEEDAGVARGGEAKGGRFWWMRRQNVPRRRSINAPWRKDDHSWNVNPWALLKPADSGDASKSDLSALTYTSDGPLIDRHTGKLMSGEEDIYSPPPTPTPPTPPPPSVPVTEPPVDMEVASSVADEAEPNIEAVAVGGEDEPVEEPSGVPAVVARKVNVAEEKVWFLKRIKADPARYDEEAVLQRLAELQSSASSLSKPQLKVIVVAAIAAAKAMRRKQLVARLESASI
ncbi:hypothetical protein GGI21_006624, partial [Coemansia aciculifera]